MNDDNKNDVNTPLKKNSTQQGVFGASMQVKVVNDGPATFWLDSKNCSMELTHMTNHCAYKITLDLKYQEDHSVSIIDCG